MEWTTLDVYHLWKQTNKQKTTLEFPIDGRGHIGLKSCQWEPAQADQTAAPWVGKGKAETDVRSSHDCSPKPKAQTAAEFFVMDWEETSNLHI